MGNGFYTQGQVPPGWEPLRPPPPAPQRRLRLALLLFLLTVISTLFVGLHLQQAYEHSLPPYTESIYSAEILQRVSADPLWLLQGWPFAATLLGILLAHELGHYFACRYYGIVASYPYFLPAPTLIGTMGAFIRIYSPIVNRRALFDVGIAGPLVGFVLAVPALALGVAWSRVVPGVSEESPILFGNPPLVSLFAWWLWPKVPADHLLLHPIGLAAWVGLFATALNLLPVGQLDGGHIIYALSPMHHRWFSRAAITLLIATGLPTLLHRYGFLVSPYHESLWPGWTFWGLVLLLIGMRHPTLLDPGPPLDTRRRWVAALGLVVFFFCFTPVPFHAP